MTKLIAFKTSLQSLVAFMFAFMLFGAVNAQTGIVSGIVKSSTGKPIDGANVVVKESPKVW